MAWPDISSSHSSRLNPHVGFQNLPVLLQLERCSRTGHLADLQDVSLRSIFQCNVDVLLDDQHGRALLLVDAAQDGKYVGDNDWRETKRRFVEKQQLGPRHQTAADGAHLL